jgi:acetylornithine deacetylase/succinyl-diaminopimelate desuccinylase-like protein
MYVSNDAIPRLQRETGIGRVQLGKWEACMKIKPFLCLITRARAGGRGAMMSRNSSRNAPGSPARSLRAWRCRKGATAIAACLCFAAPATAEPLSSQQQLAFDIYKELVEINTVTATGDTLRAAETMAARLRANGIAAADVQVFNPAPRKGNLVARLRGTGARKPILLLAHLDVVEAKREDWSVDPFTLLEKDGYYYARGSLDDKFMAATFIANLIRYQQEGYRPDRDIIVALETDEEIGDENALGIQWLLKNHRDLIDAEFALNEGGGVFLENGKPVRNSVQTSEKVFFSYRLEVKNPGGHSSLPSKDNAIYHLAEGLARLAKFDFPMKLNETTRAYFQRASIMADALSAIHAPEIALDWTFLLYA